MSHRKHGDHGKTMRGVALCHTDRTDPTDWFLAMRDVSCMSHGKHRKHGNGRYAQNLHKIYYKIFQESFDGWNH